MLFTKLQKLITFVDKNKAQKIFTKSKSALASFADVKEENLKSIDEMPTPPGLPLIGNLQMFLNKENAEDLTKFVKKLQADYGNIIRLKVPGMGNGNFVLLFKPEDARAMYAQDDRIPKIPGFAVFAHSRETTLKHRFQETVGLLSNKEEWYKVRSLVQQDMMRPKSALYYIDEMEEIASEVVKIIEEDSDSNHCYEVNKITQEYALESVAYIFLGNRLGVLSGGEDGKRLIQLSDELGPLSQYIVGIPVWALKFVPQYKTWIRLLEEIMDICEKHINKAIGALSEDSETVIAKMVATCGKNSKIPLVMGIDSLFAGIDTTGTAASFLLYHIASNPDKQEKLYEEIVNVIGPHGKITESALAKMKYVRAVQMESQRMLPSIWGSSRMYEKDVIIGGYRIPAGSVVARAGSFTSMDPNNFADPESFLPERWLRGHTCRHSADSFANLPFGHGARACIGQRFARLELYSLIIKLVQNFKMEDATSGEVGVFTRFVSVPNKQINIKFIKR